MAILSTVAIPLTILALAVAPLALLTLTLPLPLPLTHTQWFLSLFANVLPSGTLLRLWDAVLAGGGVDALAAAMVATLRRHQAAMLDTEDIAEIYSLLAEVTPAMWRADLMLADMQAATVELDPGGLRWTEMRRQREALRRQQLRQLLDETGLEIAEVAPLLGLSLEALPPHRQPPPRQPPPRPAAAAERADAPPPPEPEGVTARSTSADFSEAGGAATSPTRRRAATVTGGAPGHPSPSAIERQLRVGPALSRCCLDRSLDAEGLAALLRLHTSPPLTEEQTGQVFREVDLGGNGLLPLRTVLLTLWPRAPTPAAEAAKAEGTDRGANPYTFSLPSQDPAAAAAKVAELLCSFGVELCAPGSYVER